MRIIILIPLIVVLSCTSEQQTTVAQISVVDYEALNKQLISINTSEQTPIRKRDSLMRIHGVDSKEAEVYQQTYRENHTINEQLIRDLLDTYGWPNGDSIGERGNRTICNVLQHSDSATRINYLPLMRQAVKEGNLQPTLFVRAQDRIATDNGQLQIYGGQMKYYPETKSFNVWPVYDPINIDKRRAEIGLGPIAEFLKNRFDFEWDLEEQKQRSEEFEKNRLKQSK